MSEKKLPFRGIGTALITPMKDGKIDYPSLESLIEAQISAGIDALIIGGTTGEEATLDEAERRELYSFAARTVGARTKLILGTGSNDTRLSLKLTRIAEDVGCDGILVVTPYYNKGTEDGIYKHYSAIADSTSLPLIIYNVPSRTGVNLGFNLLCRLSEKSNVVGIKEASDSVDRLVSLAEFRNTLPIYAGNDSQIYPTLALGGVGAISVVSNLLPSLTRQIYTSFISNNPKSALDTQLLLLPLIKALFLETNPAPLKFIMSHLGLTDGELRLPLAEVRESTKEILISEYSKLTKDSK